MAGGLRRQDFYAGLILGGLSLAAAVESWRMPRHLQGWPAYAGPGVVTGLLALVLLGMAATLAVRAARQAGAALVVPGAQARAYVADSRTWRLALMIALSIGYLLLLGRQLPYQLTTGAYLAVTMLLFRAAPWWVILLVSATAATAIALVFNRIFLVPLP